MCPVVKARLEQVGRIARRAATICPVVIGSLGDQILARPSTLPLFGA